MNVKIRKLKKEDCVALTHVITLCWNETYQGIVDDEFLKKLFHNEDSRVESALKRLSKNDNHIFVLEVENEIVGFVDVCVADSEFGDCGEIRALYLLKKYQGNGYGRKLFQKGVQEIKKMGYSSMIIGCLEKNPTNEFYKYVGGKFLKQRLFQLPGQELNENVYYYDFNEL